MGVKINPRGGKLPKYSVITPTIKKGLGNSKPLKK